MIRKNIPQIRRPWDTYVNLSFLGLHISVAIGGYTNTPFFKVIRDENIFWKTYSVHTEVIFLRDS